jgi:hypothetical protein
MEAIMATAEKPSVPPNVEADMEEVCRLVAEGKRITDPELLKRIQDRSRAVQEQIREKYGEVDWAVDLIREARDDA